VIRGIYSAIGISITSGERQGSILQYHSRFGNWDRTAAAPTKQALRASNLLPLSSVHRLKSVPHGFFASLLALSDPLHGEFLALLGAVKKVEIDQFLVRKAGLIGQTFEIVHNLRTQAEEGTIPTGSGQVYRALKLTKAKRDSSLRRPTASQERSGKKKHRPAPLGMTVFGCAALCRS